MKLVGILGGRFDPIHYGHLRMAQELADTLKLSEVRFIPTATPPHKNQTTISAEHRVEMVRMAIADNPKFVLDERELDRAQKDAAASYTIDSLISLRHDLGEKTAIHLLMGSDAFFGLPTWRRWQELLDYCHIVVASRPIIVPNAESMSVPLKALWGKSATSHIEDLASKSAGHIFMQHITPLDISATKIRQDLKKNLSPRYLLPDCLIGYMNKNRLF